MTTLLPIRQRLALTLLLATVPASGAYATEPPLSLNFQNMDLRAALYALAQHGERDMVIADTIKGQISLKLGNIHWEQALEAIMRAKGLESRQVGKTLYISRREDWLAEDKQQLESMTQRRKLLPTGFTPFPLRHRQATDIKKLLEEGRLLSETGSILVDAASNSLFVTDNEESLARIRQVLEQTDRPTRQVLIEAHIVEAADNFSRDLGSKLAFATGQPGPEFSMGNKKFSSVQSNFAQTDSGLSTLADKAFGSVSALFTPGTNTLIGLELRAMQASDQGKVISSPRLLTADRTEASIEEGSEIPYTQTNSRGTPSTSFKKTALGLRIKPIIASDDSRILIEVEISKGSPNYARLSNGAPSIDTKKIRTLVQVENGGTVVLGGIYIEEQRQNTRGIPILGDLPIIGRLFSTRHTGRNRRELLVFITPQIVS
jgi:type IV pilus assembly protein PilQ